MNPAEKMISRRNFTRNCTLSAFAILCKPLLAYQAPATQRTQTGAAAETISLDQDWLFGGRFDPANPGKTVYTPVTIPHCVTKLSWENWEPQMWQDLWVYRRNFNLPQTAKGFRAFLHFDGVMVGATPNINGHSLPQHLGGYLPFEYEITEWVKPTDNNLEVIVDARWSDVPPQGSPLGAKRIDYLEPGGIYRSVSLKMVPQVFILDVFAKPVRVLEADRKLQVKCTIDAGIVIKKPAYLQVALKDKERTISLKKTKVTLEKNGQQQFEIELEDLKNIALWDTTSPNLYDVAVTLFIEDLPVHDYKVRIGFREARFEKEGFFLNGKRLQLFGLNRHELFPYQGGAMPDRIMKNDASILRHELNCNIVRCAHYPQSEAFLNACDELGLMVWEEAPGWGYLGDETWKGLFVRDVKEMVIRDRNHPSIVIWGVRVNESPNDPVLYRRTKEAAKFLDDSRPTSGTMTSGSIKTWKEDWHQDVLAYDDYHSDPDGSVGIREPDPEVPYMLGEAVGQFNYSKGKDFDCIYRRGADASIQTLQALRHAQAHSKAAINPHNCGVIAWCAFEYASLVNPYKGNKYPGVSDVFRIPKLGASFYMAQVNPSIRKVIEPNFYWDFGTQTPQGPGKNAAIFSNCDRLELYINKKHHASLYPDHVNFPNLAYPPFFADLQIDGVARPELRIDGFIKNALVFSRFFSSQPEHDRFFIQADDAILYGDGIDATRIVFRVIDQFGAPRLHARGTVHFEIKGPGVIIGDNPFLLDESGGAGAIWIKTDVCKKGTILCKATHNLLGSKEIKINIQPKS